MITENQLLEIEIALTELFSANAIQKITYDNILNIKALRYYHILFGERICSTCPNLIYPALVKLKKDYQSQIQIIMQSKDRKYNFKEGESFRPFSSAETVTNANLTDEYAENLIAKYPKLISLFDVKEIEISTSLPIQEVAPLENEPAIENEVVVNPKLKKKK